MIKALFLGIIKFVIKLMELILTPFISVVTGLFPEVSVFFGYITSFLNKAFILLLASILLVCSKFSNLFWLVSYTSFIFGKYFFLANIGNFYLW